MAQPDRTDVEHHVEAALRFPRLSPLRTVSRALSPRIAVVSTPDVDDICQRSRLQTFTDLLLPFGDLVDGKVTARDLSGVPISLDGFHVRFAGLNNLEEPSTTAVDWTTLQAARYAPRNTDNPVATMNIRDARDVTPEYRSVPLEDMTPWYRDFRNIYLEYTGATEHESFGHPVACVIAVSSLHPDPIEAMSRLYESQKVPLFDKGFVDPNILKYYVLVHDCQLGDFSKSLAIFERMRKQLGAHCHLLKLGAALNDELAPDIWAPYRSRQWLIENAPSGDWKAVASTRHPTDSMLLAIDTTDDSRRTSRTNSPLPSGILASPTSAASIRSTHERPPLRNVDSLEELQPAPLIAAADVDSVRLMIRELVVQSLIPYMERSVQYWNEQVASGRRGVAGRIFSAGRRLFGHQAKTSSLGQIPPTHRSSTGDIMSQDLATVYNYSSPEMQLRRQADFSFMLGDYRSALSVYDTLKRDFSIEKAWKHTASAQEMLGMCELIIGNGDRYDAEYNLEQVVNLFVQRARNGECATRAAILHYELFRYANMYHEAAHALLKSTDESSNLRCALFLEQAAHSFSRALPPKVRKYAFSLVLAGHRYSKEELRDRAFHCYKLASAVFDTKSWRNVENHIHFALGRQAFHQDMLTTALEHFVKLFHESDQSAAVQTSYLREFLYICQSYTTRYNKDPLVEASLTLPIPVVDDQQITVTLPNFQVRREESDDDAWQILDAAFSTESNSTVSLGDQRRPTCAVGESVIVHFEMYNPLRVTLKLSNVALECVHEENSGTDGTTSSQYNSNELKKPLDDTNTVSSMITLEYFQLENIWEVNLQPRERKKLTLKLIPKKEGVIQIIGLRYTIDDIVHGYKKFWKRGRRLNSTKAERTQQLYAPDTSLNLLVTPPMPLLDITVKHFPANMLSGEVVQATLIITNGGERDLKHLRVASSHPTMLYIGSANLVGTPAYRANEAATATAVTATTDDNGIEWQTMDNGLIEPRYTEIPFDTEQDQQEQWLKPGASVTLPLWVRADRIGRHTLRLLFHYQSEESKFKMRSRTSRYTLETQVLPSLRVNAFTRASTQNLNEYILGLEAESLQASADLVITQLSLTSAKWRIEPITSKAAEQISLLRLSSRQTLYAYYRIRRLVGHDKEQDVISPERYTQECLERMDQENEDSNTKSNVLGSSNAPSNSANASNAPSSSTGATTAVTTSALAKVTSATSPISTPPPLDMATSRISFDGSSPSSTVEPILPFFKHAKLHWRRHSLSNSLGNLFDRTVHAFTLFLFGEIDLTVFWQVPRQGRFGHHHLLGINLSSASGRDGDASSLSGSMTTSIGNNNNNSGGGSGGNVGSNAGNSGGGSNTGSSGGPGSLSRRSSTVSKRRSLSMLSVRTTSLTKRNSILSVASRMTLSVEDPIKVLVTSPSEIDHDFLEKGLCVLEISISFKNCAIGQVEFTLELEEADEAFAQRPEAGAPIAKSDASPARFDWIGITQLTGTLEENEERVLSVQACFSQPGVYNLNRWRMTVVILSPISNLLYHDHPSNMGTDRPAFTETPSQPHYITVGHVHA